MLALVVAPKQPHHNLHPILLPGSLKNSKSRLLTYGAPTGDGDRGGNQLGCALWHGIFCLHFLCYLNAKLRKIQLMQNFFDDQFVEITSSHVKNIFATQMPSELTKVPIAFVEETMVDVATDPCRFGSGHVSAAGHFHSHPGWT